MTRREVVRLALQHRAPPYVPWHFSFTHEAHKRMAAHFGTTDLHDVLGNHLLPLGHAEQFVDIGNQRYRDRWGVVWNRSVDVDIGVIEGQVLPEPSITDLRLPEPADADLFAGMDEAIARNPDRFRLFHIGFSLYERAWTLRGMEALLSDLVEHPDFVESLLDAICDWNIAILRRAIQRYELDAISFGDDWGSQRGLQMGPRLWRRLILPRLQRMYGAVRSAGCFQLIHSCGDVDEVFPDLVDAGLSCFNPFQPEVMSVPELFATWHGRLAFYGGLSTQRTLPFGTCDEVRAETAQLLDFGRNGGYILSPAHAIEGDVPLENMLAAVETVQAQAGWHHN